MIVSLGGRSLTEARAVAQQWLDATAEKPVPPEPTLQLTAAEMRLDSARTRAKVAGTKKMRAAILDALERLRGPVLGALHLREDGEDPDPDAKRFADAAMRAAGSWPDDLFSSSIDEIVRDLFASGGESGATEAKIRFDVVPKNAIDAVLDEELVFSKQFVDRERVALKSMIAQSLEDGAGTKELAEQISDFFADGIHYVDDAGSISRTLPDDSWAEAVARTETARAYNAGQLASYRAAGVTRIRWCTSEDERVCPICSALDGKTTALGDPFPETEISNPPIHVNCRCGLMGVRPGEDD